MKQYANMAELAAELKLSRSTVSYILNGSWQKRNISPKTVKRVQEYARQVNFVPNFFGRAIRGDVRSDAALLLPVNAYAHHREAFFRLLNTLSSEKQEYLVLPVSQELENPQILQGKLVAYNVRRALLVAYPVIRGRSIAVWRNLVRATPGIEWLFYDFSVQEAGTAFSAERNVGWVGFNRQDALRQVCCYVADCGYHELLFCNFTPPELLPDLPLHCSVLHPPRELQSWHADHGVTLAAMLMEYSRTHHSKHSRAVFINDDRLSAEVISILLEQGIRVPEDFAFISWDGLEISRYLIRSLTTLVVPHGSMIKAAESFLSGHSALGRHEFIPEIRVGASMPARRP